MRLHPLAIPCLAAMVLLAADRAVADTIYLKSGGVIEGVIVAETDTDITVQVGSAGKMTFQKSQIEKIEKDDNTGKIHEKPGTIKGRKKPPKDEKEEDEGEAEKPGKTEPKAAPRPKKDCPWVDSEEITPQEMQRAQSQVPRLGQKTKFRNRGRTQLRNMGSKAGRALVVGLGSSHAGVRKECAMLLGDIGYKPAVPALIKKALRDNSIPVQEQGVATLRKLSGKNFGFPPGGFPKDRQAAIDKWDAWWQGEVEKYGL